MYKQYTYIYVEVHVSYLEHSNKVFILGQLKACLV